MLRKLAFLSVLFVFVLAAAGPVGAEAPNFGEAIYADGQAWGTKGLGDLPAPNDANAQSFDRLFVFTNGAPGQLAVSEAGPGNPNYNGGRWSVRTTTWDADFLAMVGTPPVLMSLADIQMHHAAGHLIIVDAHTYFLCPLLPVK